MTIVYPTQRVLLIDDDEFVAGSLNHYLVGEGYSVDVAADPLIAAEMMKQRQYGVVVVDPYMTGAAEHRESLVDLVRATQPEAAMIVLTAYGSPALLEIASRRVGDVLLTKPQPILDVAGAISGVVRRA